MHEFILQASPTVLFPGTRRLTLHISASQFVVWTHTGNDCLLTAMFVHMVDLFHQCLMSLNGTENSVNRKHIWYDIPTLMLEKQEWIAVCCNSLFIIIIVITHWKVCRQRGLICGHQSSFGPPPEGTAKCSLDLRALLDSPAVLHQIPPTTVSQCISYLHSAHLEHFVG